jgi:hypothetical protein
MCSNLILLTNTGHERKYYKHPLIGDKFDNYIRYMVPIDMGK